MLDKSNTLPLTACVIAQNEEDRIQECIESLDFCKEVLILDGGSSDRTVEISKLAGARVEVRPFDNFSSQKNSASDMASYNWILSIDADEQVSLELKNSLRILFSRTSMKFFGYQMGMQNIFLGRRIRGCGWHMDSKLRLFHRDKGFWQGAGVHEKLLVDKPWGQLKGDIIHDSYRSISHYLEKGDLYSSLAAETLVRSNNRTSPIWIVVAPPAKFIKSYVLKSGWRDGWRGFIISMMSAYVEFQRYVKCWEIRLGKNTTKN